MYLENQFHQLKKLRWLYYKIEISRGQFTNDPNSGGSYVI